MLAQRYELKFPIDAAIKDAILARGRHALSADAHGMDAIYRVSSQYFDTRDFACYREKIDGERARRKFRLRYYTIDPNGDPPVRDAYLEIKHRINNTVYKERIRLTDHGASAILADTSQLRSIEQHAHAAELGKAVTIDAIKRAAAVPGFHAVHVISYLREAWEGSVDRRARLTFDAGCRVYRPDAYLDAGGLTGTPIVAPDRLIAEVKFDHAVPRWLRDIVAELGLKARRFSKYASGVEALGLAGRR
jgi:hypothetical protein